MLTQGGYALGQTPGANTEGTELLIDPTATGPRTLQDAGWSFTFSGGGGGNEEFQLYADGNCHPQQPGGGVYLQASIVQGNLTKQGFDLTPQGCINVFSPWDCKSEARSVMDPGFEVGGRVGKPFDSSKINSRPLGCGVTSIEYRLPRGDFLWPALWLMPSRPTSWLAGGEIDLMESMGNSRNARFSFFHDETGQRDGAALHLGAHAHGTNINFFHFLWTKSMVDAQVFSSAVEAYAEVASAVQLEANNSWHRHVLERGDDNLRILLHNGSLEAHAPPRVRLDVDQIMKGMARRILDPSDAQINGIVEQNLAKMEGPSQAFWQEQRYEKSDQTKMLELLRDYGYRAGLHLNEKEWSQQLHLAGYTPGMVVSSYALYLIAVAGAPQTVIPLNAFQNGRMVASHAAPFDAEFCLSANVAVGGNFFKGNMNTPESSDAADTASPPFVPYGAEPRQEGHPAVQFLRHYRSWLPSWLSDPADIERASFDQNTHTVCTPLLGKHTRFVLHSVRHTLALNPTKRT